MKVRDIVNVIEQLAPPAIQDEWDNSGLQVGFPCSDVSKVLVCLDVTESVVEEAAGMGCGMIVSHHPLIFKALSQVGDSTYQQRCVVEALAKGIAIYSAHTSLDNAPGGVNHKMAELIGLKDLKWLLPKAGADAGSGLVGTLPQPESDREFLKRLQTVFNVECLRHSECSGRAVRTVALCGGAGAFLVKKAVELEADLFITADMKYHDFFGLENRIIIADIGHYESEHFTKEIFYEIITKKNPTFAVDFAKNEKNQIKYL